MSQQVQSFPGRMIASYELKHQIGSGSFAVVWEAVHRETGQVVALKEIKMDKLNAKLRDNLKSEVAILQQIHHRNIVRLLDVMQVRGATALHTAHSCLPLALCVQGISSRESIHML